MIVRNVCAGLFTLAIATVPAQAFSEPDRFGEAAIDGGTGGRYFTGVPGDGLGCGVCHRGGARPDVTVEGLPEQFVAGRSYDVTLRWPDDGRRYALELELADGDRGPIAVTLPALSAQPAAAKCAMPAGTAAATAVDVGGRHVINLVDCGATELTVTFVAPSTDELFFAAGVVASDNGEDVEGDGVRELRQRLYRDGASPDSAACAAGGRDLGGVLVIAALALTRRRRRR